MKLVARYSEHIKEDLTRNWSSWNFGQEGLNCTKEELQNAINDCLENESPLYISGMELWNNELRNADIRELYPNYWVLVDNFNTADGLSCLELESDNLQDAIIESENLHYSGDGQSFNAKNATLLYSNDNIHILEIK